MEENKLAKAGLGLKTLVVTFAVAFGGVIEYVISILIARRLDPSQFGSFELARTVTLVCLMISTLGLSTGFTRFVAADSKVSTITNQIFLPLLLVVMSTGISIVGILLFGMWWSDNLYRTIGGDWLKWILYVIPIGAISAISLAFLRGRLFIREIALIRYFSEGVIRFSILVVAILTEHVVIGIVIAFYAGYVWRGAASFYLANQKLNTQKHTRDFRSALSLIQDSLGYWISDGTGEARRHLELILLGAYGMIGGVGIYSVAIAFGQILVMPVYGGERVVLPALSKLMEIDSAESIALYKNSAKWLSYIVSPLLVMCFLLAPNVIEHTVGEKYQAATGILRIVILGQLLNPVTGYWEQWLISRQANAKIVFNRVIWLLSGCVFGYFLIPKFGEMGAAFSMVASMFLVQLIGVWMVYSEDKVTPFGSKQILSLLLSLGFGYFVYIWGNDTIAIDSLLHLIVVFSVGCIMILGTSLLLFERAELGNWIGAIARTIYE